MELSLLMKRFDIEGRLVIVSPLGNGNINDTFVGVYRNTFTETQVVVQRINRNVFPDPAAIMSNMHKVTAHCHAKLEAEADSSDRVWQMPRIIKTKDGKDFVVDDEGQTWRVITRVLSAHAYDTAQNAEHALECGSVLGHFHYLVSDMDPATIVDPLPGFHITPRYLA